MIRSISSLAVLAVVTVLAQRALAYGTLPDETVMEVATRETPDMSAEDVCVRPTTGDLANALNLPDMKPKRQEAQTDCAGG